MIKSFNKLKKHKALFAIFIGTGCVLFWRGIWGIADVLIFPDNYLISSIVSTLLAIIMLGGANHMMKELT